MQKLMKKKLMERNGKKGFTLAELLIVVAIIGVLVAISVPIFTGQLEKSRDAVTIANLRSAYSEAASVYLLGDASGNSNVTISDDKKTITIAGVGIKCTDGKCDVSVLPFKVNDGATLGEASKNLKNASVAFTWADDGSASAVISGASA